MPLVHGKELPVPKGWKSRLPTWEPQVIPQFFIAWNCRYPEVGTLDSQPGNVWLPWQGTAGSQRLELTVANWEPLVTIARNCRFPKVKPQVTIARNCRFPRGWNSWLPTWDQRFHWLPLQSNCPVPKGWNSRLPTWEPQVTIARNLPVRRDEFMVPNLRTTGYHCKELPVPRGWNSMELLVPNLGTIGSIGYHCKQLPVPKAWN